MSLGSKKAVSVVIGTVAVAAVIAGTVAVAKRNRVQKHEDEDEAFSSTKPSSPSEAEKKMRSATSGTKSPVVEQPAVLKEESPVTTVTTEVMDADRLLDEALNQVAPKTVASAAVVSASTAVVSSSSQEPSQLSGGRTELSHLGISVKIPSGWEVREELSPVPNVAMVTVWNPEFANMPNAEVPGAVPVIILSVEDIHGENLNLAEFKERSKELSMQQMLMMTGGAIQPVIRKDSAIQEGSFRHMLEYAQSMPPFFDISVINLLEVRNGIAYVFQIMANPRVMNTYKSMFMQIARETIVTPMGSSALGHVRLCTGKVVVDIDTTWSWSYNSAGDTTSGDEPLATFELASSIKREKISLYEAAKVPKAEHKPRDEKELEGVRIVSSFNGMQERKVFSYGDYSMVVEPQQKAISFLPELAVVLAIKSTKACTDPPRPKGGATFSTSEYGYMFDIVGGSRVISTKLGKGTVVYAPMGVPLDLTREIPPDEHGPTVTIRIGNPEDDSDCMGTIEEWHSRITAEATSSDITSIKITDRIGEKCLSFTSKEMQESGPGEKTEVVGNVYIFVRNGITTLIRWEAARNQWRKFERDLDIFLESFRFLE